MHPVLMFLLAIAAPVILAAILLIPPYVGITAASYVVYYRSGEAHPLGGKLDNVFYMIDVYSQLFSQWAHHISDTSILTYALPLLMLPIMGIMLSIWLSGKAARKLKDIFQHGVSY